MCLSVYLCVVCPSICLFVSVRLLCCVVCVCVRVRVCVHVCMLTNHSHTSLQDCLQPLSMQALPASPESLCMVEMGHGATDSTVGAAADPVSIGGLFLNIGLQNGVLLRTAVDNVTGDLSDTRTR